MGNASRLRLLDTFNDGQGDEDENEAELRKMTTGALDLHLVIEFCFAIYFGLAHAKSQQQKPTLIIHIYKQNDLSLFLCLSHFLSVGKQWENGQVIYLKEAAKVP